MLQPVCEVQDRLHHISCQRELLHRGLHYAAAWWFTADGLVIYDARMPREFYAEQAV